MISDFDSDHFDALESVPREFAATGQGRGINWR